MKCALNYLLSGVFCFLDNGESVVGGVGAQEPEMQGQNSTTGEGAKRGCIARIPAKVSFCHVVKRSNTCVF